jgi:hypothetical protein
MKLSQFPTKFTDRSAKVSDLAKGTLSELGQKALNRLEAKGLSLEFGLTQTDAAEIKSYLDKLPQQCLHREYAPRDQIRFGDPEKWMSRGRAVFVLKGQGGEVLGWSWTRFGESDMAPGYGITTGLRTSVKGTGKDLIVATLQATRAFFEFKDNVWLETWASNERAVGAYLRTGAVLLGVQSFEKNNLGELEKIARPTVYPSEYSVLVDGSHYIADTRLYMGYPDV